MALNSPASTPPEILEPVRRQRRVDGRAVIDRCPSQLFDSPGVRLAWDAAYTPLRSPKPPNRSPMRRSSTLRPCAVWRTGPAVATSLHCGLTSAFRMAEVAIRLDGPRCRSMNSGVFSVRVLCRHVGRDLADCAQIAHHLDVHVGEKSLIGDFGEQWRLALTAHCGGAIDKNIDAAELAQHFCYGGLDSSIITSVSDISLHAALRV
jgi:hypothetical protein